jgi:RNA polymerase sigma factor for flagellar operon FliA
MTTLAENLQQLIEQHQDLVRSLARSIHRKLPPYVELDDLIAYGQIGLAEAARDFDAARGNRFSTYAYYRVRGAIYDGLSKMTWFSRAQYSRLRGEQMANEVLQVYGDQAEGGVVGGVEDDMRWLRNMTRALAVVYLTSGGGCEEEKPSAESLEDRAQSPPAAIAIQHEVVRKLHELISALPPEAGGLIRGMYFEGLTLEEAGRRLGISKSWACRLHAKTLDRLARSLRLQGVTS